VNKIKLANIKTNTLDYIKNNNELIKRLTFLLISLSLMANYVYIITGYTCPDGICEGLTYYIHGDWHLACGRWFVRYFNKIMSNNLVIPLFVVLGYTLFIIGIVLILKSLFSFDNNIELYIIGAQFITTPAITGHILDPHISMTFSAAFFFSILFAYYIWKKNVLYCIPATICITLMMGLYQAYISSAAALVLILIIFDLLEKNSLKSTLINTLKALVSASIGVGIDVLIYTNEIKIRGLMKANRVADFSFDKIISNFFTSLRNTYSFTYEYFFKIEKYGRQRIYAFLLVVFILSLLSVIIKLIKNEKWYGVAKSLVIVILFILLPVALNVIHILIPYNDITLIMQSHYVLLFVLLILFFRYLKKGYKHFINSYACIVTLLTFSYLMTSNATHMSVKESYTAINTQTSLILNDVYDTNGYIPNETTIVFVGYPSEQNIRNILEIYQYAIGLSDNNQAFWYGMQGVTTCRQKYLMDYFGIDAGYLSEDDFYSITETPEFARMPVWPAKGSVKMIDGKVVVRLTEKYYPKRE